MGSIFSEQTMIDGTIFKYEQRLNSHMNKFIANGAMFVTWYRLEETSTTVDRGFRDMDQLLGPSSPIRFDKILDFPIYGFGESKPENSEESDVEDITVSGEFTVLPSTIVPSTYNFFTIKHLKMTALYQVTEVQYDSMKQDGFYKVLYRLYGTDPDTINQLNSQVVETFHTDMNAIGGNTDAILTEDDFILRGKIKSMVNKMIDADKAMYYNERHKCFIF